MKLLKIAAVFMTVGAGLVCNAQTAKTKDVKIAAEVSFDYVAEQFADREKKERHKSDVGRLAKSQKERESYSFFVHSVFY